MVLIARARTRVGCRERVLGLEVDERVRGGWVGVVDDVLLELRLGFGEEDAVLRALRACDRRHDRAEVELHVLAEDGLLVRVVPQTLQLRIYLDEGDGLLVTAGQT